jgi:hypothetical protein
MLIRPRARKRTRRVGAAAILRPFPTYPNLEYVHPDPGHQTFDIFVVVLYNIKQHRKTHENATTRNTHNVGPKIHNTSDGALLPHFGG